MVNASAIRALALTAAVLLLAACGKKESGKPPPAQPWTGAPVAVVVDKINQDGVDISAYNFSDKTTAQYVFLVQYKDKDGKVLKVKPGTPFEKEFDFMSMSGRSFKIEPKSWSTMTIDMLEPPDGAVTAEAVVSSVGVIAADGNKLEDYWELETGSFEWPVKK